MHKGYLLRGIGNKIMNSHVISRKGYDSDVDSHSLHYFHVILPHKKDNNLNNREKVPIL
jgi:hypothetical protein